ncbi:MAG: endo-1,4-beta-xylanase [Acidobacteriaceae bacterium]
MRVSRRKFLHGMAGVGATSTKWLRAAPPLRVMAQRDHLKVGVAAQHSMLSDPTLVAFITSQCSALTPGKEFCWSAIHPAPDRYDYREADWMMQFVTANELEAYGHTLCWNDWYPSWLNTTLTAANAEQILTSHINTVVGRYRGRFASWDVVNEPIRTGQKNPDGLNGGPWLTALGPRYINIAFETAAQADPQAVRVLNLDTVEQDDAQSQQNRDASLKLIERLLAQKVPLQSIGLESHLSGATPPRSKAMIAFIRQIKSMGLPFMITEMDVNDTAMPGDDDTRKRLDGQYYFEYLQEMLSLNPAHVVFWTPTDRNNYWDSLAPKWSMYRRADGGKHHPGILDADMSPNPAFEAIRAALSHVPYTNQE